MSTIRRDKAVEQLDEIVAEILRDASGVCAYRYYTDKILSIPELAVVDRKAELPHYSTVNSHDEGFIILAQQDMLEEGWVREVKNATNNI